MGFRNFMDNRNGNDDLNRFLTFAAIVLIVLSFFFGNTVLSIVIILMLVCIYFRAFSKNINKRYEENQFYLNLKDSFFSFFTLNAKRLKDRAHKYYKCPRCGRVLRVPRNKGRIAIHCPTCGTEFVKKT